jgi:hypothetical protein
MPLLPRRFPIREQPRIDQLPVAPNLGAGLPSGRFRGGGNEAANACLTVRR